MTLGELVGAITYPLHETLLIFGLYIVPLLVIICIVLVALGLRRVNARVYAGYCFVFWSGLPVLLTVTRLLLSSLDATHDLLWLMDELWWNYGGTWFLIMVVVCAVFLLELIFKCRDWRSALSLWLFGFASCIGYYFWIVVLAQVASV